MKYIAERAGEPFEPSPPLKIPVRLLLVEDSLDDAKLVRRWLERPGPLTVDVVHTGWLDTALEHLERAMFDVAVVDLTLPDSIGLSTLFGVLPLARSLPIVVLTATDDERVARLARRGGVQEFLIKGRIDATKLIDAIVRSMSRSSPLFE